MYNCVLVLMKKVQQIEISQRKGKGEVRVSSSLVMLKAVDVFCTNTYLFRNSHS